MHFLKQHYVTFEILLSGSPYSWETLLSSTTVVKSVMVTPGDTRVHLLTSRYPRTLQREFSRLGQTASVACEMSSSQVHWHIFQHVI